MKNIPTASTAPEGSLIALRLTGAYFHDAWMIHAAEPNLDALDQFLRVAKKTPAWIDRLMRIRNHVVGWFGLKNLGSIAQIEPSVAASNYQAGDRVGIFTLISNSDNEVLLGDSDKHLNVVVSVHKQADSTKKSATVTVTTVVHVHNWLGRLYMMPVTPAHKVIVRSMVRAIGN
jgi:methionine synthase II (cobalamin-independent)